MDAEVSERERRLEQEHVEALKRILAANEDFPKRVLGQPALARYDVEDDSLFVTWGPPVEAVTESVDNALLLRVEPESLKLVGVEVIGLKRCLVERPQFYELVMSLLGIADQVTVTSTESPPAAGERAARRLRELIPA